MRSVSQIWAEEMALIRRRERRDRLARRAMWALDLCGFIVFLAFCVRLATSGGH